MFFLNSPLSKHESISRARSWLQMLQGLAIGHLPRIGLQKLFQLGLLELQPSIPANLKKSDAPFFLAPPAQGINAAI
jgi:hypothetical protein